MSAQLLIRNVRPYGDDAVDITVLQQVSNGVHMRMAVLFTMLVGTESEGVA